MIKFKPSKPLSIGVELELQLLNGKSLNLADGILPLMDFYPDSKYIMPEFIQNTVEIRSKVCHSIDELRSHMITVLSDLQNNCKNLGMKLCGAGTHPFSKRLGIITPFPRFIEMEKSAGLISHTQITFSTHVHLGMTSGEETISTMHKLRAFAPLLIALSANSPFWRGYETGYVSYRHRILDASRSYGLPPYFHDWEDFKSFFKAAKRGGVFKSINDIHWDIRPRPHLGTLEIRIMDAQSTVNEVIILSNFLRVLVRYLIHNPDAVSKSKLPYNLPWWIEKENRFQASRLGPKAKYIKDERGSFMTVKEVWQKVFKKIKTSVADSDEALYIEKLSNMVEQGEIGYRRQKKEYDKTGSHRKVVSMLVDVLEKQND